MRKVTILLIFSLIMLALTSVIFDMDKLGRINRELDEWWDKGESEVPEDIDTEYPLMYLFYIIIFGVLIFISSMIFIIGHERKNKLS